MNWLFRGAFVALLLLPAFVMHGRAVADILLCGIDAAFLVVCAREFGWSWTRTTWVRIAGAWWVWLMLCSLPFLAAGGWFSFGQAIATGRFLLLVAALEFWLLRSPDARKWLMRVLTACAAYIAAQAALQFATGRDLQGFRRHGDGELTGPFENPRAGAPLSRLLFPAILPALARLGRLASAALAIASIAVVVLIGQRMPLLLTIFGLLVSGLLLRRLRAVVAGTLVAGMLLVAATPIVSPPTWHRLGQKFSAQMADFPDSDYGLLAARAVAIVEQHPWLGRGFAGFRFTCSDPATFIAWDRATAHLADGGGLAACNIHPHNHYTEAATDAGLPGLALFCAMILAWLVPLGRGLWRNPDPLRVGLFVAALIQEWPVASTSSFTAMEIGGFFFVLLGLGLAEARYATPAGQRQRSKHERETG